MESADTQVGAERNNGILLDGQGTLHRQDMRLLGVDWGQEAHLLRQHQKQCYRL